MKADAQDAKRRWLWAGGGGALLTLILSILFRAPSPAPAAPRPARPTVGWVHFGGGSGDSLLNEQTALHDPTPLFLPTARNARPPDPQRNPGVVFASYPPNLLFPVEGLALPLPHAGPDQPAEALAADPPGNRLMGIGRSDVPVPTLPARGAYIEVTAAGTGEAVFSAELPGAKPPEGTLWQPLEFVAAVDPTGLVGPLVLTVRSDVDAVDAYFERYLTRTFWIGKRLPPGFYRVRVGP